MVARHSAVGVTTAGMLAEVSGAECSGVTTPARQYSRDRLASGIHGARRGNAQDSEARARSCEVAGETILICRLQGRRVFALSDVCPHDDGPLGEGVLTGQVIECPRHGARFDVTTGAVLRLPAASPVPTYPVRVDPDGWIMVDLEDSP